MSERLTETNSWLVVWRFTREARHAGKPQRMQRRYRTEAEAREAASKRLADDLVKAVWLWGPAPVRESGRPGPRPQLDLTDPD